VVKHTFVIYKNYSQILIRYSKKILQKLHIRSNKRQARQLRRMTSVIKEGDLITGYAAVASISFFIALFSCNFAHGQQVPSPSPILSPSLPIDPADRQRFQLHEEQTSGPQLTAEQEQRQQQLTVDEILKDPTGQASELIEEGKEATELEIKQRLDEVGGDEDGDREGSQRGGVREEQNNGEEDNANSDIINDGEAPLDLQLPIPFP
jgi:hypothetical protein